MNRLKTNFYSDFDTEKLLELAEESTILTLKNQKELLSELKNRDELISADLVEKRLVEQEFQPVLNDAFKQKLIEEYNIGVEYGHSKDAMIARLADQYLLPKDQVLEIVIQSSNGVSIVFIVGVIVDLFLMSLLSQDPKNVFLIVAITLLTSFLGVQLKKTLLY